VKIIAVTGGVATGKTTVSKFLSSLLQAEIIDADKISRKLLAPGEKEWEKTVRAFGSKVLTKNSHIDRRALGKRVFGDVSQRKKLERIIHPAVKKDIKKQLERLRKTRQKWVIIDIPLLFEAKMGKIADKIILVVRSRKLQIETLRKDKKLSLKEAKDRIDSQLPLAEKIKFADFIIDNNGTIRDTKRQLKKIFLHLF
jgi:dephospho-CoA kinase